MLYRIRKNLKAGTGFIFLALPLLLIVCSWYLNNARGAYWLGSNSDPEYVYLLNAANLAMMHGVGHIDHPGTPVQVLGAVVIRAVYHLRGSAVNGLQADVLKRPEFYLKAIQTAMLMLNVLMLWLLGWVTYSVSRNKWLGLWLQAIPLFSPVMLQFGLTRVTPEPMLLLTGSAMVLVIVLLIYLPEFMKKRQWLMWLLPAIVVGFGVANKITFVPLGLIGLIVLPGIRKKIYYSITCGVGFVVFTLPIIRMYDRFFGWIFNLLSHSGKYGSGASGLVSSSEYLDNIKSLLSNNPFFTIVLILSLILLILLIFLFMVPSFSQWSKEIKNHHRINILIALVITQIFGLLMVSKHSSDHYLLPVLGLSGVMVLLLYGIVKQLLDVKGVKMAPQNLSWIFIGFIGTVFLLINPVNKTLNIAKRLNNLNETSMHLYRQMQDKYKDHAKIYYYRSSSPEYGLKFGSDLSRSYHAEALQNIYKNVYFYDIWTQRFTNFDYNTSIKWSEIVHHHGERIVFQGTRGMKIKDLESNHLALKEVSPRLSYEGIFIVQWKK
jgi:hypothetical protein